MKHKWIFCTLIGLITIANIYVMQRIIRESNSQTVISQQSKRINQLEKEAETLRMVVKTCVEDINNNTKSTAESVGAIQEKFTGIKAAVPLAGKNTITSRFGDRWGRFHGGIDLKAKIGAPVKAGGIGKVIFADWLGDYGLLIKVDYGDYIAYYGHLSKILIKKGTRVKKGDLIGKTGKTGRAYGEHLHYEIRVKLINNQEIRVNPETTGKYYKKEGD